MKTNQDIANWTMDFIRDYANSDKSRHFPDAHEIWTDFWVKREWNAKEGSVLYHLTGFYMSTQGSERRIECAEYVLDRDIQYRDNLVLEAIKFKIDKMESTITPKARRRTRSELPVPDNYGNW